MFAQTSPLALVPSPTCITNRLMAVSGDPPAGMSGGGTYYSFGTPCNIGEMCIQVVLNLDFATNGFTNWAWNHQGQIVTVCGQEASSCTGELCTNRFVVMSVEEPAVCNGFTSPPTNCQTGYHCVSTCQGEGCPTDSPGVCVNSNTQITVTGSQIDMVGIFQIVYVPCPVNVQCNPQYQLAGDDGNSYQLLFVYPIISCPAGFTCTSSPPPALPQQGQRIEVKGTITYNTGSTCRMNGQGVPCQPIGTIAVSSWTPISTTSTLTSRTEQYTASVPVGGSAELRLATNPSTGCSWWIQSQPSGVEITTSSGTDSSIDCAGRAGCSNLQTIYTIKGLAAGEYVVEFRNGHAWAKNEYYIVVLFHLTVLPQTQVQTTVVTVSTVATTYTTGCCPSCPTGAACAPCPTGWPPCQPYGFPSAPTSLADIPRFLSQFWAWVAAQFSGQFSLGGSTQSVSTVQGTAGETITLTGTILSISADSQATRITVQVANANARFQPGGTVQFIASGTALASKLQLGNNIQVTMSWVGSYWEASDIQLLW